MEEDISNPVNRSLKPGGLLSVGTGLKLNGPAKEGGVSDMLKQLAGEERKVVEVALGSRLAHGDGSRLENEGGMTRCRLSVMGGSVKCEMVWNGVQEIERKKKESKGSCISEVGSIMCY